MSCRRELDTCDDALLEAVPTPLVEGVGTASLDVVALGSGVRGSDGAVGAVVDGAVGAETLCVVDFIVFLKSYRPNCTDSLYGVDDEVINLCSTVGTVSLGERGSKAGT